MFPEWDSVERKPSLNTFVNTYSIVKRSGVSGGVKNTACPREQEMHPMYFFHVAIKLYDIARNIWRQFEYVSCPITYMSPKSVLKICQIKLCLLLHRRSVAKSLSSQSVKQALQFSQKYFFKYSTYLESCEKNQGKTVKQQHPHLKK